jgi:hypothetical protein
MFEGAGRKDYRPEVTQPSHHAIRLQAISKPYQSNDIHEP